MNHHPSTLAFFDSGMGGLTVLQEAMQWLPQEHYVYFADSENAPYGTKSSAAIIQLVEEAVCFLVQHHALKALIIACNTATSVAIKNLRAQYNFPIIGMEPALKPALALAPDKAVLVCATEKTLQAPRLQALATRLEAKDRILRLSLQELVSFAEQGEWDSPAVHQYLQEQFREVDWGTIQAVVLGCTHFPYYRKVLQHYVPSHLPILDGHAGTIRQLQARITPAPKEQTPSFVYYRSKKLLPTADLTPFLKQMEAVS